MERSFVSLAPGHKQRGNFFGGLGLHAAPDNITLRGGRFVKFSKPLLQFLSPNPALADKEGKNESQNLNQITRINT